MTKPLRVLLVEDSEDDALLVLRALSRTGWDPVRRRVETATELREALQGETFDLVISDWILPRFSGMDALTVVQAEAADLPFIICSGKIDEEMAVSALRAGAKDFVTKHNLSRLGPAVERELNEAATRRSRREAEEEVERLRHTLARAERLEEVGTIASQVAHDVGNLLTPLLLYADLIKRHLTPDHAANALCDRMTRGLHHLADVTQDLLTLGRRGQLPLEPVGLNPIVHQALDALPQIPSTLRLELQLAPELPPIAAAAGQLARAVMNLLTNAREAMNDCGLLTVRSALAELPKPCGLLPAGRYAAVEVIDTGCGISPENIERIFEPFFTTKSKAVRSGSGLGLAIVHSIVTEHHGAVSVESQVGKGTKFTIHIPIVA